MSKEVDSVTQTCENSHMTLKIEDNPEELPPRIISYNSRRPRFGIGNVPLSPYILIDGKKLRSALAFTKKSPTRRVSFPTNDNHLVTGCLEPANPWKLAENVNRDDLITAYKESCKKHDTDPLEIIISQLEALDTSNDRSEELDLKGQPLDCINTEPLEEILKRVQFNKINLEGTSLDQESSVILFDMFEYYESARHLNISSNPDIGSSGWQACANLIRKTQCLEHLEAKDVMLNEQYMNILSRALRVVCHLHVLKLDNCGLSGRSLVTLVAALKMNSGIRELYLADNGLNLYDAIQLGSLLRFNNHIQLLDVSNNSIQDDGVHDILEGLINQINEDKSGRGLNILILWNNQLTKKSSPYFARLIACCKTLETLNIGKNVLTDELLLVIKEALKKNSILLQLGVQSTNLTCDGIVTLSETIEINQVLRRIDLRNNNIQITGLRALNSAMEKNKSITKIDLDDKTDGTSHQYMLLVAEIRACCTKNEQNHTLEGNREGSESSHHSRFCSINSRKISLTCHTLPCSLSPMISIQSNKPGQSMFEPKCINGSRLRSPVLSPVISPVASPIPSPSRNRFVVSRVPETSICSVDSHPKLPVTLSSFRSSPTCFTSSASGSSRFRVSVVESASTVSLPKSVIASPEVNASIDSNFEINATKSADTDTSDTVHKSELGTNNDENVENFHSSLSNISCLVSNVAETTCTLSGHDFANTKELNTSECLVAAPSEIQHGGRTNYVMIQNKTEKHCDEDNHTSILSPMESNTSIKNISNIQNYYTEPTENVNESININKHYKSSSCIIVSDKTITTNEEHDTTNEQGNIFLNKRSESQAQRNKKASAQKHTFNPRKLFASFQHSNCFFSNFMHVNQFECNTIFQDSISIMMMLGNKFLYYLKEKRDRVCNNKMKKPSILIKNKSIKTLNIFQLSNFQNLTNIFSPFKFQDNLNISKQNDKFCFKTVKETNSLFKKECKRDLIGIKKFYATYRNKNNKVRIKEQQILGNQFLPADTIEQLQNIHLKSNAELGSNDLVSEKNCTVLNIEIDTCSKIVSNALLVDISKSKMIVPLHKLIDTLEYSVSKALENNAKEKNDQKIRTKIGFIPIKGICDKILINSINVTSDNNFTAYSVIYDLNNMNDMCIVNTLNRVYNLLMLNLNLIDDAENNFTFSVHSKQNNLMYFLCNRDYDCTVNKMIANNSVLEKNRKTKCSNNEVSRIHSVHNNKHNKGLTNVQNMSKNTDVNSTSKAEISKINFIYKDCNLVFSDENTYLHIVIVYKRDLISMSTIQKIMKPFITESERYLKASYTSKTKSNYFLVKSIIDSMLEITSDCIPITRAYSSARDFDKSGTSDLILYITDTSISRASITEFLTEVLPNATKAETSFDDFPQASHSSINLITEEPKNNHGNTQAFRVGKKKFSVCDKIQGSMHFHKKQNFLQNDDSENESKHLTVFSKAGSILHSFFKKDNRSDNSLRNIHIFTNSGLNIPKHLAHVTPDAVRDIIHTYISTIKSAVVTPMCSKVTMNIGDRTTLEIVSDQSTNVAEPSSMIHIASM